MVVAAAAEQENQDDDPPAVISAPETVVTHTSYLRNGFVTAVAVHSMLFLRRKKVQTRVLIRTSGRNLQHPKKR